MLPKRTRLFRIEPLGLGTSQVESFKNYFYRLATAHAVTPFQLLCSEMPELVQKTPSGRLMPPLYLAHREGLVQKINELTGNTNLQCLTMTRWRGICAKESLVKRVHAWCPRCLTLGQPYERLLWTISSVSWCPVHRLPLVMKCPNCNKVQSVSRIGFIPGRCLSCRTALTNRVSSRRVLTSEWNQYLAFEIGRLLSIGPIQDLPDENRLQAIITYAETAVPGDSCSARLKHFRVSEIVFSRGGGKTTTMKLENLCRLAYGTGLPLPDLLLSKLPSTVTTRCPVPGGIRTRRGRWAALNLESQIRSALSATTPATTQRSLAAEFHISPTTFKSHCPVLCKALRQLRRNRLKRGTKLRLTRLIAEINLIRLDLQAKGLSNSPNRIRRELKLQDYRLSFQIPFT